MFLVHTNSDSAKREKVCHLRIDIYMELLWSYMKKESTEIVQ